MTLEENQARSEEKDGQIQQPSIKSYTERKEVKDSDECKEVGGIKQKQMVFWLSKEEALSKKKFSSCMLHRGLKRIIIFVN